MRPKPDPPLSIRHALREIGEDVRTWRKLRGLTQAELADRAGISLNTLRRLEQGAGGVAIEHVLGVLRGLGVLSVVVDALDPFASDVGRLRSAERLPQRVRAKNWAGDV